ncbi:MAG: hypothetical protein GY947_05945 [Rhodobacteraceae bacterium]|nr:hypothetical protein [Paracoccaceae bacterium]
MKTLIDIASFQYMIAPYLLQVLFWAGIGGTLYGTYVLYRLDNWAWWLALVFGLLGTRVIFEFSILAFRAFDRLNDIRDFLEISAKGVTS